MSAGDEMVRGLGEILAAHEDVSYNMTTPRQYTEYSGWLRNCQCGRPLPDGGAPDDVFWNEYRAHVTEALAAHVLGLVAAGKAEALREAAKELPGFDGIRTHGDAARWLRDRADGLAGEAS